jgi:hypothetical protein
METLVAIFMKIDITFKEAKSISGYGPLAPKFTGRCNLMNEIGQIIGFWLTEENSYAGPVFKALKGVFIYITKGL